MFDIDEFVAECEAALSERQPAPRSRSSSSEPWLGLTRSMPRWAPLHGAAFGAFIARTR